MPVRLAPARNILLRRLLLLYPPLPLRRLRLRIPIILQDLRPRSTPRLPLPHFKQSPYTWRQDPLCTHPIQLPIPPPERPRPPLEPAKVVKDAKPSHFVKPAHVVAHVDKHAIRCNVGCVVAIGPVHVGKVLAGPASHFFKWWKVGLASPDLRDGDRGEFVLEKAGDEDGDVAEENERVPDGGIVVEEEHVAVEAR